MSTRRVEIGFYGDVKPLQQSIAVVRKDLRSLSTLQPVDGKRLFAGVTKEIDLLERRTAKVFNFKPVSAAQITKQIQQGVSQHETGEKAKVASTEKHQKYLLGLRQKHYAQVQKLEEKGAEATWKANQRRLAESRKVADLERQNEAGIAKAKQLTA